MRLRMRLRIRLGKVAAHGEDKDERALFSMRRIEFFAKERKLN